MIDDKLVYKKEEAKKEGDRVAHGRRGGLFKKISKRLLLLGVMPIVSISIISFALMFVAYRGSNAIFEETMLNLKNAEIDRFVAATIDEFRLLVDGNSLGDVQYLNWSQQTIIIQGQFDARSDQLEELALLHTYTNTPNIVAGSETARCIRGESQKTPYRCSVLGGTMNSDIPLRERIGEKVFEEVALGSGTYIGPIEWSDDGVPSIEFGVPIRLKADEEEKKVDIAVIVGRLRIDGIQDLFDTAIFTRNETAFFTDNSGRVIAHSLGDELIGRDASPVLSETKFRFVQRDDSITVEPLAAIMPRAFERGYSLSSGIPVIFDYNKPKEQFGRLIIEWPWQDAFLEVLLLEALFVFVAILLILIIRLVGLRLTRQIITPIRTVQLGAERIGRGDFSQRIVVNTDDELEELGESINSMSEDLMKLEKVRTAETRARALATAVAKEESLKEEKDVLIATASHQFRTPVTALNWNIDLLRKMSLPDDARGLLDGVAEHTKNLATIASDLLNSTAFGAGYRVVPDAKPVNIMQTLDEVIERYAKDAAQKPVTFTRQYPDKQVLVRGSFAAIRIAFEQLVSNAIRYSKQSGVVTVTIRQAEDGRAGIDIADTGIGIPEDEQQFLFDAFFRAKNSIIMKNVGTGLGLYVANNIITGHGGLIEFSSEENKGTTFTVTLPGMGAGIEVSPPAPFENPLEDGALDDSPKEE